ncbi:MAG TPA: DinB family protein [Gemmatimonadaceae bacterium]|nr:DinB family protein [Gemmatimonadaceae bacterium]
MIRRTLAATLLLAVGAATLAAQQPTQQSAPDPAKVAAMAGMRGALDADLADLEGKYLKLAEAMKAKFDYRPAAGVRSAGEVFAHVAAGNHFIPGVWGVKAPAGINPQALATEKDPDKIIANLKASFAHVRASLGAVPDAEMDRGVKLFGQDATVRRAQMPIMTHMHEHLGQSIAYARASGVTPPWSAGG